MFLLDVFRHLRFLRCISISHSIYYVLLSLGRPLNRKRTGPQFTPLGQYAGRGSDFLRYNYLLLVIARGLGSVPKECRAVGLAYTHSTSLNA